MSDAGRRVFVVPRQMQSVSGPAVDGQMAVALAEVCGLAITYSEKSYAAMDQDSYAQVLAGASLASAELERLAEAAAAVLKETSGDSERP